ncbi:hypothetical protein ATCC90586_011126 [Pythium insidiosum]|nr:hypothetical protein ATCC90586_011126 [Pythium insidiosum]
MSSACAVRTVLSCRRPECVFLGLTILDCLKLAAQHLLRIQKSAILKHVPKTAGSPGGASVAAPPPLPPPLPAPAATTPGYRFFHSPSTWQAATRDFLTLLERHWMVAVHFEVAREAEGPSPDTIGATEQEASRSPDTHSTGHVAAVTIAWSSTGAEPAWILPLTVMDQAVVRALLQALFVGAGNTEAPIVVAHGVHAAAHLLHRDGLLRSPTPRKVLDLQLVYEELVDSRVRDADLWRVAQHFAPKSNGPFYVEAVLKATRTATLHTWRSPASRVLLER